MLPNLHLSFFSAIYLWFLGALVGGAVGVLAWNVQDGHPYWRPLVVLVLVLIPSLLTFRTLKTKALEHQSRPPQNHSA